MHFIFQKLMSDRALVAGVGGLVLLLLGGGCETTNGGGGGDVAVGPMKGVLIDAGHGGEPEEAAGQAGENMNRIGRSELQGYREECYGAINASGYKEKTATLAVSQKIQTLLERDGVATAMTRTSDRYVPLDDRVSTAMSHQYRDWIFVSIHFNRSSGKQQATKLAEKYRTPRGFEIYVLPPGGGRSNVGKRASSRYITVNNTRSANHRLAQCVESRLSQIPGMVNRGIKEAWFVVLRGSPNPALLIEGGFMSNPEEGRLIESEDYQWKYARAVVAGIEDYRGQGSRADGSVPTRQTRFAASDKVGLRD